MDEFVRIYEKTIIKHHLLSLISSNCLGVLNGVSKNCKKVFHMPAPFIPKHQNEDDYPLYNPELYYPGHWGITHKDIQHEYEQDMENTFFHEIAEFTDELRDLEEKRILEETAYLDKIAQEMEM